MSDKIILFLIGISSIIEINCVVCDCCNYFQINFFKVCDSTSTLADSFFICLELLIIKLSFQTKYNSIFFQIISIKSIISLHLQKQSLNHFCHISLRITSESLFPSSQKDLSRINSVSSTFSHKETAIWQGLNYKSVLCRC